MAIPLPNLDDKTFAQLMEEAKAVIPRYTRDWTNFNPSDPGITMLELFAWINEMIIYRQNTITRETKWELLKLLMPAPKTAFVEIEIKNPVEKSEFKVPAEEIYTTVVDENGTEHKLFFNKPQYEYRSYPNAKIDDEDIIFVRYYNYNPKEHTVVIEQKTCCLKSKNQVIPIFTKKNKELRPLLYHPDMHDSLKFYGCADSDHCNSVSPKLIITDEKGNSETWEFKHSLLDATKNEHVFTFDYHRRAIVFGDGFFGAIPPANATLTLEKLQLSDGTLANVSPLCEWRYMSEETPSTEKILELTNPGMGQEGEDWYSSSENIYLDEEDLDAELLKAVIKRSLDFHRPPYFRAVTQNDYVEMAKAACQSSTKHQEKEFAVDQAWVIQNYKVAPYENIVSPVGPRSIGSFKDPILGEGIENHVSVLVLNDSIYQELVDLSLYYVKPEYWTNAIEDKYTDFRAMWEKYRYITDAVFQFLNRRRLLTTMLHVSLPVPQYFALRLKVKIVPNKLKALSTGAKLIREAIVAYFNPFNGGFHNEGRPVGQPLYKSEIYTLVEKMDFVDVVEHLTLFKEDAMKREYNQQTVGEKKYLEIFNDNTSASLFLHEGNSHTELKLFSEDALLISKEELLVCLDTAIDISVSL